MNKRKINFIDILIMKFTYKKIYYLLLEQNYQEHGVGYVFIIGTLFVMNMWEEEADRRIPCIYRPQKLELKKKKLFR